MTTEVRTLTPAEHRLLAEADISRMRGLSPGNSQYRDLALSGLLHVLSAVASYLEPPPRPVIPGLPEGWDLDVAQGATGKWRYELRDPSGQEWRPPKSYWSEPETALAAGVGHARQLAGMRARTNGEPA
jgi:hypothetical protein